MPHPPRILYAAPDPVPFPKGAATRIEATVRALCSHGAQVDLLTTWARGETPPPRLEGIDGLTHRPVAVDPGANFLDRMLYFRQAVAARMREETWDVAWFRSPWEGIAAVREGGPRGCSLVYEAHGLPSVELPFHYPGLLSRPGLLDKLIDEEACVLGSAHQVITPSATGRTYLRSRGVPSCRIRIVPNCAVPRWDQADAPPPPGPPWRILYVGTLAPWQGLGVLLEAMALARGTPDLRLQVVGTLKGQWWRELRRQASALGVRSRLDIVGPVPREQLPSLYSQAHVCVAPLPEDPRNSLQGCCPIKIVEYMASARPVLATRIRPVEELIEHGRTGWLVAPGSPWALLTGLRWMVSHADAREEMGRQARVEVERTWHPALFQSRVGEILRLVTTSRAGEGPQESSVLAQTSS